MEKRRATKQMFMALHSNKIVLVIFLTLILLAPILLLWGSRSGNKKTAVYLLSGIIWRLNNQKIFDNMSRLKRANSDNADFQALVKKLDIDLK